MSRGKHRIPISLFRSPEPAFRARTAAPDAVNEVVASFSRYSSVHENSVVVLFWPESKALPGPDFDPAAFSQSAMAPLDGFFAIVGDHTQQAVKQLHRDYSRNAMWSSLTAEVLVCHRSAKNYAALKSWGILDNVKGEIRTNMDFLQMVLSLHEDLMNLLAQMPREDENFAASLSAIREVRRREYRVNANSFRPLWLIASRTGPAWDAIERIIHGRVANAKTFKVPKTGTAFNQMGNIPEEDLVVLLQKVVTGQFTMKGFTAACRRYKARARVQGRILDILVQDDWDAATEAFPTSCSDSFVGIWTNFIVQNKLPMKNPLPAEFHRSLAAKKAIDENEQEAQAVYNAVSQPKTTPCNHNHDTSMTCNHLCLQKTSVSMPLILMAPVAININGTHCH